MAKKKLFILDIVEDTVVDGPGFRTTIYASGCPHHCRGCHNPRSWDMTNGDAVDLEEIVDRIIENPFNNVTFSGGDPLMQAEAFTELAKQIKSRSRKTIWCYTGYLFEHICRSPRLSALLPYIDVLVDGRFELSQRDISLLFRGSANQRLVDVPGSMRKGEVCLYDYSPYPAIAI